MTDEGNGKPGLFSILAKLNHKDLIKTVSNDKTGEKMNY